MYILKMVIEKKIFKSTLGKKNGGVLLYCPLLMAKGQQYFEQDISWTTGKILIMEKKWDFVPQFIVAA